MKKLIVVSVIMAVMLLTWGSVVPAHAQAPTKDDAPTFYHLVPGTFVNGWPRFTIHYPKDWVEGHPYPWESFRAAAPRPTHEPTVGVGMGAFPAPLEKFLDVNVQQFSVTAHDVTVVSDKPSKLRDGTPARESELRMLLNGSPYNFFSLATKKGDFVIAVVIGSSDAKTGEDLKAIAYTLEFQAGFDEPVKVPPDVQEFLDKWRSDIVSHDIAKVMTYYSDRYLYSGETKGEVERSWKQAIASVTSYETVITDFEAAGDKAYLAGFASANLGRFPLWGTSIIKENGEWRWYGNQRHPAP
jgi:hypothetical protein